MRWLLSIYREWKASREIDRAVLNRKVKDASKTLLIVYDHGKISKLQAHSIALTLLDRGYYALIVRCFMSDKPFQVFDLSSLPVAEMKTVMETIEELG